MSCTIVYFKVLMQAEIKKKTLVMNNLLVLSTVLILHIQHDSSGKVFKFYDLAPVIWSNNFVMLKMRKWHTLFKA